MGKSDTKGLQSVGGYILLSLLTVALNVIVTKETCSSVTISWTPEDNRTVDFLILYNSRVHSGTVNYRPDASPSYTKTLTNLVADTEYIITVIDKNSDNTTRTEVTANTHSGTLSEKGMYYVCNCLDQ